MAVLGRAGEWRSCSLVTWPRKGLNAVPYRLILKFLVISTMLVFSLDLHHVPDSCVSRYQSSAFPAVT
jgi:hypothetical protein